jgi:hypothetical protein
VGDGELMVVFGPPAVGKMTVGRAVCERTDFRLFLNHDTIEPLIRIFGFGTPAFRTLNSEFRRRIVEEAAASGTQLLFTLMWDLQEPESARWVRGLIAPYADAREKVRIHHAATGSTLLQVHLSTPVEVCAERDVKGLYAKAYRGEISSMTGVDDPYEIPADPDLRIDTAAVDKDASVAALLDLLTEKGLI